MEILFSKLLPRRWHSPGALAGLPPGLVVGEILEPGNFALLNGLSSQAGQQILAQFLSVLVKPSYGGILLPEAKQLFTYGDVTSVRMYGGKGFRVIDGSAPVSKFGSDWQQLQAAPEDLLRVLDTLQSEKGAGDLWQPLLRSFEYLLAPETNWALAV